MLSTSLVLLASIALPGDTPFQGFSVEHVLEHPAGSSLAGFETIRVYAELAPAARIDAVYGNSQGSLQISCSGGFFQDTGGGPTSQEINDVFFPLAPDLEWDSYVSIGCLYANGHPFVNNSLNDIGVDWTLFEGGDYLFTDNGAWFVTPDDEQGNELNGKVFLGQFTIPMGEVFYADMNLQGKDSSGVTWNVIGAACLYEGPEPEPVIINEIRIDQSGSDSDEYFELKGQPGSALDGLTYIVVGDGSGGSGVVESISDLSGFAIPADGVFLAGESSMSIAVPDATMTLGFENSDNVTHMLVSNFTGSLQEDLDFDDDGVFDVTPWDSIEDSVSLVETPTSGDQYYSSNTVGPDGTNVPGHAVFCDAGWQIGGWDISSDTAGDENDCSGPITDCNSNGVEDADDIANGTSLDCDLNGVPDECDPDCGTNGVPDACEPDCDKDGTPDDCEVDSDSNGVPDDCEIVDCNSNGVDDEDDIGTGTSNDCDANGVPDECESLDDCNANGVADACDISNGTSADANGNGVPDECKGSAPAASINEVRIDQSSSDNDEYVELAAAPGTVLDGLTYVVIGDGSGGSGGAGGSIECAVDLTGTVGASGYFLVAENTFTLNGVTPDQVVANSPFELSLNFENGDNVTHMLVYGFGGAFGDDVDVDDDGVMDFTPWLELVDSVAFIETVGSGELVYSANQVGPNGTFVPAHIYNCGGSWLIGDFGLGVNDTPGAENDCPIGSSYCFGDATSCPCANGGDGSSGCANSAGAGGTLSASGDPSLSNDTVVLTAEGLVPSLPCLFFSGANQVNGGAGLPFGDGLRCAGFEAVRIQVTGADAAGEAATSVEVSTNGQAYGHTIEVGETVNYQCWYRDDVSASPCGNSFNATNGYSLLWNL